MDFLPSSVVLQKTLGMKKRSKQGIFFTPKPLRDILFAHVKSTPSTILEPSCGSGEFLVDCRAKYPNASLAGVELDPQLAAATRSVVPDAEIHNKDFLTWGLDRKFDLVVGNPPFVQTKAVFPDASVGRSNLYIEFLYKCITYHLNEGGILAMVIPSTIMNGCFSKPTRDLILTKKILFFDTIRNHTFKDTSAGVSILVLENTPSTNPRFDFEGILTKQAKELRKMSSGRRKIKDLDLRLQYGTMTASLKDSFSRDSNDVPFILHTDVKQDEVSFDENKRLYIKTNNKTNSGRCLFLSRSNGVVMGNEYILKFSMFEAPSFLFDSAFIAVFGGDIDTLYKSLSDPRSNTYLQSICGSGRLTKDIVLNLPIFE
ncbi:DNA methyltransferase [Only Syngen Nebraska virus 5]|uniref:DNA methyltransferase n=1 Tax=Only Syngen Nebraska virus 5 TaxID=1917232 RepID=UPI000901503F|nr:DNA methyltransferase [Only Syngen Nebraska virus 5]APC25641.1 DNA adenine methyltransferase [Only Syngen Nebraska virus 5]